LRESLGGEEKRVRWKRITSEGRGARVERDEEESQVRDLDPEKNEMIKVDMRRAN